MNKHGHALATRARRQARALGRRLKPTEILRRSIRREIDGRLYSELVRRVSPPNRIRDDLSVDGQWRFSESFDGERAWYRDKDHSSPTLATRALAFYRWTGTRLDYLQPLTHMVRLGCTLEDRGIQSTADGQLLPAIQIAMLDQFAETVFLDEKGRIVAHHLDLPEAGEEERELEVLIREWSDYGRPPRSLADLANWVNTATSSTGNMVRRSAYPG